MSKIKVNEIEKASGSGITVPTGSTFTITDGLAQASIADQAINEAKLQISNAPTNGYFLSAQSGNTGGLTWAEAGGGGKILQVVPVTWKTAFSSTVVSGTYATITDATATITPSATSSKIWFNAMISTGTSVYAVFLKIQRDGSDITDALGQTEGNRSVMTAFSVGGTSDSAELQSTNISYVDSPSSTSALTYTIQGSARSTSTWTVNYPYDNGNYNYNGHAISTITLLEIGV